MNAPPSFTLSTCEYVRLRKLVSWTEGIPDGIELTEGAWDLIHDRFNQALGRDDVVSIQIETRETRVDKPNYTRVLDLVALIADEDGNEIHVPIY